jgi:serine/threonine protein kinase
MLFGTILRNRYKILNKLGSGGFSDTYVAEDMDLPNHPKCVVKHLVTRNSTPEVLEIAKRLFNQEAEVLYRLGKHHDQIPQLLAHFEENGEFYLVQEYIDGHDLTSEIVPGKQLSEAEVVKLLQEILEVLAVVHEHNVIHRDIKLQNIMRRKDGKIVLIDFGSVKEIKNLANSSQGEVTSTIVIGTPGYIPNEQANGNPRLCSDIYAVGMLAIQALTGVVPQKLPIDSTTGEVIWRHFVDVSDQLANVLTKMVHYNFSKRYQTAAEALAALRCIIPPTTIGQPPPLREKEAFQTRSPDLSTPLVIPVLGLFSLIVVGFGVAIFGGQFFQFSLRENKQTNTIKPNATKAKTTKFKILSPTPIPSRKSRDFNNLPSTLPSKPLQQDRFDQTQIQPSVTKIENKAKPSATALENKIKPSPFATKKRTHPPNFILEDDAQPSTPPVGDSVKPCTPAIEDNSKSCPSENEETAKPSTPPVGDSVKPCTPAIEDNSKSCPSENEETTKPPTSVSKDGKNQMMMVTPTPIVEEKNNQLIVPATPLKN